MAELNDAVVLDQLRDHWQKVVALLVFKLVPKGESVTITAEDMLRYEAAFVRGEAFLLTHGHKDGFEFRMVDKASADRLMAHEQTQRGRA